MESADSESRVLSFLKIYARAFGSQRVKHVALRSR